MSSSFPHYSALAGSLQPSTSPTNTTYASNLEALIARAQSHPHPRSHSHAEEHSPDIGRRLSRSRRQSESVIEDEETLLLPEEDSAAAGGAGGKGKNRTMSYGAVEAPGGDRRRRQSASSMRSFGGARGRFRAEMGLSSTLAPGGGADAAHHRGPSDSSARPAAEDDDVRSIRTTHTVRTIRESVLDVFEPHVLLAEQGGETADDEEERILGHLGGGDLIEEERDLKQAIKDEAKVLTFSTIPVLMSQMAEFSLIIASVISIGHLSSDPTYLAASSLASMTASVACFSILQGIASSLDTLLPAAWTSDEPSRVGTWSQRVTVVLFGASLPMYFILFNAESILLFLKQEPEVAAKAALYLKYLSFGLPGYGLNCVLKKYFQAQGKMNVPTYVIFAIAPVNLFLNWFLVWGPKIVRLGFVGAPLATAISINLEAILFIVYATRQSDKSAWAGFSRDQAFSKLGTVAALGLAGTGQLASEWWSWEVVTLAASQLGPTALAAQSILLISCSVTYQIPVSLSISTAVRAGNLLGAGRGWESKIACYTSLALSVFIAGFNSLILILVRNQFALLFNDDPGVVALVGDIIPYVALFQLTDGLVGVLSGILRVLGRQNSGALINSSSYYVFGLPIGIFLCFNPRFELGLKGLWIGLSIALFYSAVLCTWIVLRADWEGAEVDRARERVSGGAGEGVKYEGKDVERAMQQAVAGAVAEERQRLLGVAEEEEEEDTTAGASTERGRTME